MFLKLMGATYRLTSTRPMPTACTSTCSSARGRRSTATKGQRPALARPDDELPVGGRRSSWPSTPSGPRPSMSASESPPGASAARPTAASTRGRRPGRTLSDLGQRPGRRDADDRSRLRDAPPRVAGGGQGPDPYVHAGAAGDRRRSRRKRSRAGRPDARADRLLPRVARQPRPGARCLPAGGLADHLATGAPTFSAA